MKVSFHKYNFYGSQRDYGVGYGKERLGGKLCRDFRINFGRGSAYVLIETKVK